MPKVDANVKDKSRKEKIPFTKVDFLNEIRAKCSIDDQDKFVWKNKMIIAHHQRLGVKRYSNFPYPGAPDIPLPETDKLIKKSLPTLVLSAWGPKKICTVKVKEGIQETPELKTKAKRAEMAMNMYLRSKEMDWFRKLTLAADNLKQFGHCVFKTYEKFSTRAVAKVIDLDDFGEGVGDSIKKMPKEGLKAFISERYALDPEDEDDMSIIDDVMAQVRSGDNIIEFTVNEVTSMPMIDVILPHKLTVPAYTTDIAKAERIKFEYFLSRNQLERLMEDEIFLKKDLDDFTKTAKYDAYEQELARSEGVTDNTSGTDLYRIEEICCWYKLKDSKDLAVRKVFTFLADVHDPELALLQDIDFPFEFDGWNYDKHDNEFKDTRYYNSRGVPEQIRAMQEIMERSINNMIIRDEMMNTPLWEVLDTSEIMDGHIAMVPGGKIPVKQLGQEVKQLNEFPKSDTASQQIMQLIKAYTEEYLAVSDQLFRNATNSGGGKTLGEINVGIQQNSGPANLEVISWNDSLSKVYDKVFRILAERLGDSIYIEGQEITREDFNFPAEVRSNGDLEVSNEQLAVQKAQARLSVLLNPQVQDIVNSDDRYSALKDWLEKDGVKDPDQFCTDPKIIAQEQIAQMQQQLQAMQQQAAGLQEESKKQIKRTMDQKLLEKESAARTEEQNAIQGGMNEQQLFSGPAAGAGQQPGKKAQSGSSDMS